MASAQRTRKLKGKELQNIQFEIRKKILEKFTVVEKKLLYKCMNSYVQEQMYLDLNIYGLILRCLVAEIKLAGDDLVG